MDFPFSLDEQYIQVVFDDTDLICKVIDISILNNGLFVPCLLNQIMGFKRNIVHYANYFTQSFCQTFIDFELLFFKMTNV